MDAQFDTVLDYWNLWRKKTERFVSKYRKQIAVLTEPSISPLKKYKFDGAFDKTFKEI